MTWYHTEFGSCESPCISFLRAAHKGSSHQKLVPSSLHSRQRIREFDSIDLALSIDSISIIYTHNIHTNFVILFCACLSRIAIRIP